MNLDEHLESAPLTALTAGIVAAYVQNNVVPGVAIGELISCVHMALTKTKQPKSKAAEPFGERQKPAIAIRKSVTNDFLICLEDGKPYKSLKRHLSTKYGMSPDDYRAKWGLPDDYPMVAPAYAEKRSQLARTHGLGQVRGKG
jgi:predicted transcriptional regulator